MFLVDEVLLRSHDRQVVLHCARVVLRVEVNLALETMDNDNGSAAIGGKVKWSKVENNLLHFRFLASVDLVLLFDIVLSATD